MLAIFYKAFANPLQELHNPASQTGANNPKLHEGTLKESLSHHPDSTFSMTFGDAAVLAHVRTLRDRRPYPTDQVVTDLDGSFVFVVHDSKAGTVFAALVPMEERNSTGGLQLMFLWLYVMTRGDQGRLCEIIHPVPKGCEGGLRSFEHPMHRMKAIPRVDSEGMMCGATFSVDVYTMVVNSIPRRGSEANWMDWECDDAQGHS